ncbi:hypothetical protein GCM10007881_64530 [Mesorhizobium huakuii]|nr:hypothetical protein GCM10007881_64530 [Mesorhizobium huakuii]
MKEQHRYDSYGPKPVDFRSTDERHLCEPFMARYKYCLGSQEKFPQGWPFCDPQAVYTIGSGVGKRRENIGENPSIGLPNAASISPALLLRSYRWAAMPKPTGGYAAAVQITFEGWFKPRNLLPSEVAQRCQRLCALLQEGETGGFGLAQSCRIGQRQGLVIKPADPEYWP